MFRYANTIGDFLTPFDGVGMIRIGQLRGSLRQATTVPQGRAGQGTIWRKMAMLSAAWALRLYANAAGSRLSNIYTRKEKKA
jgi:hypothetical protein